MPPATRRNPSVELPKLLLEGTARTTFAASLLIIFSRRTSSGCVRRCAGTWGVSFLPTLRTTDGTPQPFGV